MANETQFIVAIGVAAILVVYFTQGEEKEGERAAAPQVIVHYKDPKPNSDMVMEAVVPLKDYYAELAQKLETLENQFKANEAVIGDAAKSSGVKGVGEGLRRSMERLQELMPAFLAELNQFSANNPDLAGNSAYMVRKAQWLNQKIANAVKELHMDKPTLSQSATYQYQQNVVNTVPLNRRVGRGRYDPSMSRSWGPFDTQAIQSSEHPGQPGAQLAIEGGNRPPPNEGFVQGNASDEVVIAAAADRREGRGGEEEGGSSDLNDEFNAAPAIQPVIQVIEDKSRVEDADGLNIPAAKKRRAAKPVEGKPPGQDFRAVSEDNDLVDLTKHDSKPSESEAVRGGEGSPPDTSPAMWLAPYKQMVNDQFKRGEPISKPWKLSPKSLHDYFDEVMKAKKSAKAAATGSLTALKKRAREDVN